MKFNSDVTVVITTYNREKLLKRAIDSVLAQTYPHWDMVIVDDASTDNTTGLVQRYNDKRIRYIRHTENKGSSASLNTGILSSDRPYLCILDSDDEFLPGYLEKHLDLMKKAPPEVGVVYCQMGERQIDGSLMPARFNLIRGNVYEQALWQGYLAPMITLLVKRECFDKVGVFDTQFPCFKDDDICFRLSKYYSVDFVPEILAVVNRDASDQLTRNPQKYSVGWYSLLQKHHQEILKECGVERLSRHYVRAAWLFLKARRWKMVFQSLQDAYQLYRNPLKFILAVLKGIQEKVFKPRLEGNYHAD